VEHGSVVPHVISTGWLPGQQFLVEDCHLAVRGGAEALTVGSRAAWERSSTVISAWPLDSSASARVQAPLPASTTELSLAGATRSICRSETVGTG
jgi:hypothetical protein